LNDWVDLEHHVRQQLKEHSLLNKKILVGLSGGVDSLALCLALSRVVRVPEGSVTACYAHHGDGLTEYRDQALKFCAEFCAENKIPFHFRKYQGAVPLKSEADLRDWRYGELRGLQWDLGVDFLAVGHHRDDLLETRLMRLIRGTGPEGLEAMRTFQAQIFRPFLKIAKKDLAAYLDNFGVKALEDPSNQHQEPLRNWLRQTWLVALEERQEGSVNSLARSLETLTESRQENSEFESYFNNNQLSRPGFLCLTKVEQKQALARLLWNHGVRNFSQSQLAEVQKRLDNPQKEFTFHVAGMNWHINAQQIRVQDSD
jgi:tRNA(Ile)-lysidine synthase